MPKGTPSLEDIRAQYFKNNSISKQTAEERSVLSYTTLNDFFFVSFCYF